MPTKKVAKGITRFEDEPHNSNGFLVRICRQGNHVNQFFSDKTCGGKRKARQAAEQRYQELLEEYGPAETSVKGRLTARNSTGVVGVHVAQGIDSRWPDSETWAYCASWVNDDGTRGKISFSWKKYGEKKAMQLAKIARQHETTDRVFILSVFEKEQATARKRRALKAQKVQKQLRKKPR
jgi:hypothetical protein